MATLHLAAATKKRARVLMGLLMGIALNGACMSEPTEHMSIDRQIRLSPAHRAMPYGISRASNGDLIVFGSIDQMDFRAWATRVSSNGEVRWEFLEGGASGWEDKTAPGQRFYGVVELPDQTTVLCGIKVEKNENLVVLVRLRSDGTVIAERIVRPKWDRGFVTGVTCIRWDDGVALFGGVSGVPRGTGWFAKLDAGLNLQWEKLGDQYVSRDIIAASGGGYFLVNTFLPNPDGSKTSLIKMASTGDVVSRHAFSDDDGPQLICPVQPRAEVRVALFKDTLKTVIVDFDDQLRGPKHVISLHNAGVKKPLELPDGSIAIFGSQFHGTATAAVTRVYKDGSSKGFLVEPQKQSGWFYDAVYTGNRNEFAAVRSVDDLRAVLDWISFR
jgi:hypothetical protein